MEREKKIRNLDDAIKNECVIVRIFYFITSFAKMASKNEIEKICGICRRSTIDERALGHFQESKSVAAHVNCVLFSPVTPDATSLITRPEDDGIAGVSARFIRQEIKRAKNLVISPFHFSIIFKWFSFFASIQF